MNTAVDWIAKSYFKRQFDSYKKSASNSQFYQLQTLLSLIKTAVNTSFGREYHFANIDSYKEFCKQIPIRDYEDFLPYIEQMLSGKQNILWPEVKHFSRSSGTSSGRSKYLPISVEALSTSHVQTGKNYLATYLHQYPDSRFFYGKGIVLTGNYYKNDKGGDAAIADVSMLLYAHTDSWIRFFKSVPMKVATLEDWEVKLTRIAEIAIAQNITNISGVPSWMLLLLRKVLEISGKKSIAEVWPDLALITHGGVDFIPYKKQFESIINKEVVYRNVYNSSEGFFAFQEDEEDTLTIDFSNQIFYELEHAKSAEVLLPFDAKIGERYTLIVTTNSGLWRYRMGDQIKVVSIFPFRFRLVGRSMLCINVAGEELIQANTDKALAICCEEIGCTTAEYTVAPFFFENEKIACHQWAIEFEIPPKDLLQFSKRLDAILCSLNSDYAAKRSKNLALGCLSIIQIPQGTFVKWLAQNNRLGAQAKVPRLRADDKVLKEIVATA
jgi:hypothetical protein